MERVSHALERREETTRLHEALAPVRCSFEPSAQTGRVIVTKNQRNLQHFRWP